MNGTDQDIDTCRRIEQDAREACFSYSHACDADERVYRYGLSIYARRILRAAGYPSRGWVGQWLPGAMAEYAGKYGIAD